MSKVLMPESVAKSVNMARYFHEKRPDRMLKYVLEQSSVYVEDWLSSKKNMDKLMDALYTNKEIIPTADFLPLRDAINKFMDGFAFCVQNEDGEIPYAIYTYEKEENAIYMYFADKEGDYVFTHIRDKETGELKRYERKAIITQNPLDYAHQEQAFFTITTVLKWEGK